jgi:hypothetical protein
MPRKKLRYRPLQPAHHSDRITVEQVVQACRELDAEERARTSRRRSTGGRQGRPRWSHPAAARAWQP